MNSKDYYGQWFVLSGGIVTRSTLANHSAKGNLVAIANTPDMASKLACLPNIMRASQATMLTVAAVLERDEVGNFSFLNLLLATANDMLGRTPTTEDLRNVEEESVAVINAYPAVVTACRKAKRFVAQACRGTLNENEAREVLADLKNALADADPYRYAEYAGRA